MSGPRAPKLALLAACASLLLGCSHAQVVGSSHTLHLAVSEYRLSPQDVHASAGDLTIYVRNDGRLTHNLVISHDGQPAASTQPIRPGQTAALTMYLLPGTYSMASTLFSDQVLGAFGTLKVSG
jgi:plastocyanin